MNYSSTNSIRKVVVSRPPMIRCLQILMFVNWTAVLVNSRKNTTGPGRPKNAYEGQLQLYPQNSLVSPIVINIGRDQSCRHAVVPSYCLFAYNLTRSGDVQFSLRCPDPCVLLFVFTSGAALTYRPSSCHELLCETRHI